MNFVALGLKIYLYYCEYAVLHVASEGYVYYTRYNGVTYWGADFFNGKFIGSYEVGTDNTAPPFYYVAYGDVCYEDGTPVETAGEETYVLGDIDGTAITEDMLNPDGTVTIDGVTYYPSDYIDYSNLTDTAQIDLLNEILDTLDRSAVVEQEQDTAYDMVGDVAVELDIAEFNNFVAPAGIADVFPFCLPFDFVRGLQLLAVEPVAPVFEIPFNIPSFGLFGGYEGTVTLDMSKYSTYFEVARWVQVVLFMIGLCFISFKVVKGVH